MSSGDARGKRRGNAFVQFVRYVFGIGYERNVGGAERPIRYTLGGLCVLLGVGTVAFPLLEGTLGNSLLALVLVGGGLFLIYEARVQYCPLNQTLDRSTLPGE